MKKELNQTDCHYSACDLRTSWERMVNLAKEGSHSWIRYETLRGFQSICILCCLAPCCPNKSAECELSSNAVIFLGKNTRRKAITFAIQITLQPKDVISLGQSSQKTIWIPAVTGRIFGGDAFGKETDELVGVTNRRGIEIKLTSYAICDVSSQQKEIKKLRGEWNLQDNEGATYFEVTGVLD